MFSFQKSILFKSTPLAYKLFRGFATEGPQKFFVLSYKYVEDMHYKRSWVLCKILKLNCPKVPYKDDHLKKVAKLEKGGSLIFGGSLFPNDGAYIIFNCKDESVPNDFVKSVKKVILARE